MQLRPNQLKKQEWVNQLRDELASVSAVFLIDPKGVRAQEDAQIRRRFKEIQARYRLVRNRLAKRAIEGTPFEPLKEYIREMTAVGMYEDGVALAKLVKDLSKEFGHFHFRAAIVDGQLFTEKQLDFLANLPPREVLQAQFLSALNGPPRKLVRLLAMPMILFLALLNQVKDQRPETTEGGDSMAEITKEQVIEYLSNLTVTQLVELVKELEETWGVEAAAAVPVAAVGAMPGAAAGGEAAEEKQVTYKVVITDAGQQKVQLIKALREIFPDLGLKEAKAMVDQLPKAIKEGLTREEAEELKEKLTAVGATVEIQ